MNQKSKLQNIYKIELWLQKNAHLIYYILLGVLILFSALHFNLRLSIAGDDSTYITRAINFWNTGKYPDYQAPLYPIFLSLFIGVFGVNLFVLKATSFVLTIGFFHLFYQTFKDKVSYITLFFTLGIFAVSYHILFFASQTYSEPLFMLISMLLIKKALPWLTSTDYEIWKPKKENILQILGIAALALLLFFTRTVGFGAILAIITFLLVHKKFKKASHITLAFLSLLCIFMVIKGAIWGFNLEAGEQSIQLLNKHPYDMSQGKETISGFLMRFVDNSNLYLSKHTLRIIGFRDEALNTVKPTITIILYIIFIWGFIFLFKKNKTLVFVGLYIAFMLGITFFSLQKLWDQYRLIIPFVPFVLVYLGESLFEIFKKQKWAASSIIIPLTMVISVGMTTQKSYNNIDLDNLEKNIKGDIYAGFTPDYVSYLQMINFVKDSLPAESYVACRKPNIARIYANGKKFYGIYRIPSENATELAQVLKDRGVTHVIMASLRKTPAQYTGYTINTIKRYLAVIVKEHPQALKLVMKYGDKEPTYLFEINYNEIFNN